MTIHIILTVVLWLLSINAIKFLNVYLRLLKSGIMTNGIIVAYEASSSIMTKNVLLPKVKFQTEKIQSIVGKPIYSQFTELNNYKLEENCIVFYDENEPKQFILKSNIELLTNLIFLIGAVVSVVWLVISIRQQ